MVVVMRRYVKGDKVEVKNTKETLENSWHPARIIGGQPIGDVYSIMYEGGHQNGMVEGRVLVMHIRPRPPVVGFSNWSRGDLVHVFDNFAWKLATVLQVLAKKQFLVRVLGSMKDLIVGAAWIRVRHCWQDNQWFIVGKGPTKSEKLLSIFHKVVSDAQAKQMNKSVCAAKRNTRQNAHIASTKAIKRTAPSTINQMKSQRRSTKISRTAERTSPCPLNQYQIEACTQTGMKWKVTQEHQGTSRPPATNATLKKSQHDKHEDSGPSSVGSCSINYSFSSHHNRTKCAEHLRNDDDVSDAESCTDPSP
ncbi:hypothetical protein QQ045_032488 [Rhodiola kirilowii]